MQNIAVIHTAGPAGRRDQRTSISGRPEVLQMNHIDIRAEILDRRADHLPAAVYIVRAQQIDRIKMMRRFGESISRSTVSARLES